MAALLRFDPSLDYDARVKRITSSGLALWDVLKTCDRDGSLDSSIVQSSEEPNDVHDFVSRHPSLRVIVLNGAKAAASYRRWIGQSRDPRPLPPSIAVPSTSGANTSFTHESLLEAWTDL